MFAGADESDPLREFVVVRVAREDRLLTFFQIRNDVRGGRLTGNTQQQIVVTGDGKPAPPFAAIAQTQQRDLCRRIERREHQQLLRDAMAGMFEN